PAYTRHLHFPLTNRDETEAAFASSIPTFRYPAPERGIDFLPNSVRYYYNMSRSSARAVRRPKAPNAPKAPSRSRLRRERERVETRERILDVAREMFVRRGYEATTMRAIADELDYTATALYHHFRSKDELMIELCLSDFRALGVAFAQHARITDPIERILRTGEAYVDFGFQHPMQYQFMFLTPRPIMEMKRGITRGDPSQDAYAFIRHAWAEALAAGRLRPEFTDPDELAQMSWA